MVSILAVLILVYLIEKCNLIKRDNDEEDEDYVENEEIVEDTSNVENEEIVEDTSNVENEEIVEDASNVDAVCGGCNGSRSK